MASIEYDLGYLNEGLASLENYLLSDEIYWNMRAVPPRGEPAYPLLSLGGMLLAKARLEARQLSYGQSEKLSRLGTEFDRNRTRWRTAWMQKAEREFSARLRMWRDFIEDYRQNPDANIDRYAYEVSRRVMLHFLHAEASQIPQQEREMLAGLDNILMSVLVPGEFIWEKDLQRGFPAPTFPYLYGTLKV
jgi:hypothetical protein